MKSRIDIFAVVVLSSFIALGSSLADSKSIQGTVTGKDGKPASGVEVRAERLDAKAAPATVKTDAQGNYVLKGLPVGAYAITASVKGAPKSRASVRTRSDGWAKVDFDLRIRVGDPSLKKRYVWVKGEPGTRIGGHWVEVDEANAPGLSDVEKTGSQDLRTMQQNQAFKDTSGMNGH